ncbi:MAG: hypothetical protein CVV60_06745, partial [Tenericutes bacterium HGW-Tenericutes-5]
MNNLQERIFNDSKILIKKFNFVRFLIYFAATVSVTIIILLIANLLSWFTTAFVLGLALIYSFVRDWMIARYSLKTMDRFYQFLSEKT